MIAAIDAAKEAGDTLGGAFEVIATGLPPGLGSYVQWDRKLDGRLAQAVMCIHAIKAVGIGIGPEVAFRPGSRVHDEILPPHTDAGSPVRPSNNAGGLEGGVTNGQDVRVTGFMKPIATLMKPLRSVDLTTLQDAPAAIERSDVCAVPAAAVVGEAMVVVRAGRRVSREVRRRLDRRDRAALRRHGRGRRAPVHGSRHRPRRHADSAPTDAPSDRPPRRGGPAPARRAGRRDHARDRRAHRRHDSDDVRRARHRTGGAAGRRRQADLRVRHLGRPQSVGSAGVHQPRVRRARRHAARRGRLPERARLQRHGRASGARRPQGTRSTRRAADRSRPRACWRAASSTRWITSTARCSSIVCAACRRI